MQEGSIKWVPFPQWGYGQNGMANPEMASEISSREQMEPLAPLQHALVALKICMPVMEGYRAIVLTSLLPMMDSLLPILSPMIGNTIYRTEKTIRMVTITI